MKTSKPLAAPIYSYEFTVPETAVDQNGHVNNVMYVQWMQDAAVRHYEAMGGTQPTQAIGATWVVGTNLGSQYAACTFVAPLSLPSGGR